MILEISNCDLFAEFRSLIPTSYNHAQLWKLQFKVAHDLWKNDCRNLESNEADAKIIPWWGRALPFDYVGRGGRRKDSPIDADPCERVDGWAKESNLKVGGALANYRIVALKLPGRVQSTVDAQRNDEHGREKVGKREWYLEFYEYILKLFEFVGFIILRFIVNHLEIITLLQWWLFLTNQII